MARDTRSPVPVHLAVLAVDGPGAPVVLLHGVSDSTEGYRPVLAHLEGRRPARAVSFRGHGVRRTPVRTRRRTTAPTSSRSSRPVPGRSCWPGTRWARWSPPRSRSRARTSSGLFVEDSLLRDPARADAPWFDVVRRTRELVAHPPADDDDAFRAAAGELPVGVPGRDARMRDVTGLRFPAQRASVLRPLDPRQRAIPRAEVTVLEGGGVIHLGPTPVRTAYLAALDALLDRLEGQREVAR